MLPGELGPRVGALETWRCDVIDPLVPFIEKFVEDQRFRARYLEQRAGFWRRGRRMAAWITACASAVAVVAQAVIDIAHLF